MAADNTGPSKRTRRNTYAKYFAPDTDLEWLADAACTGNAPAFDYDQALPRHATVKYKPPKAVQEAKEVCWEECPVRLECLEFALRIETPQGRSGVYGGLTPNERDEVYIERNGLIV